MDFLSRFWFLSKFIKKVRKCFCFYENSSNLFLNSKTKFSKKKINVAITKVWFPADKKIPTKSNRQNTIIWQKVVPKKNLNEIFVKKSWKKYKIWKNSEIWRKLPPMTTFRHLSGSLRNFLIFFFWNFWKKYRILKITESF